MTECLFINAISYQTIIVAVEPDRILFIDQHRVYLLVMHFDKRK